MDLLHRIDEWGRSAPERVAFHSASGTLRWGELVHRSDALAGALAAQGDENSPVMLCGHKQPEMLVGMLGCAKAGRPYVPVDEGIPTARVERIRAAAGARPVLTPDRIREMERLGRPHPGTTTGPETPIYVMFTSGSTGEPKGVVITRGCLDAFLEWMLDEQRFHLGAEVFLNQALFSFDLSVMDTWSCLATGGRLECVTSAEQTDFVRLFDRLFSSEITTWVSTPTFAQLCLAEPRFSKDSLPTLRRFLFCGDVLTPEVAATLIARFPSAEVWNTYGPTEATVATTSVRVDGLRFRGVRELPIGCPMPGTSVTIEEADGTLMPDGERGEIVIVGPNVSPGYLGRPDLTARSFFDRNGARGYRTGDWGTRRDGLLYFHGRIDSQVKIAGYRIEIGDVETHLAALPMVRGAVVVPEMRDGRAISLHAFITLAERPAGSDFEIVASIKRALASHVPAYMIPQRMHFLDRLPLTPNGKADRAALSERLRV